MLNDEVDAKLHEAHDTQVVADEENLANIFLIHTADVPKVSVVDDQFHRGCLDSNHCGFTMILAHCRCEERSGIKCLKSRRRSPKFIDYLKYSLQADMMAR